eukprot:gene2457-2525_t
MIPDVCERNELRVKVTGRDQAHERQHGRVLVRIDRVDTEVVWLAYPGSLQCSMSNIGRTAFRPWLAQFMKGCTMITLATLPEAPAVPYIFARFKIARHATLRSLPPPRVSTWDLIAQNATAAPPGFGDWLDTDPNASIPYLFVVPKKTDRVTAPGAFEFQGMQSFGGFDHLLVNILKKNEKSIPKFAEQLKLGQGFLINFDRFRNDTTFTIGWARNSGREGSTELISFLHEHTILKHRKDAPMQMNTNRGDCACNESARLVWPEESIANTGGGNTSSSGTSSSSELGAFVVERATDVTMDIGNEKVTIANMTRISGDAQSLMQKLGNAIIMQRPGRGQKKQYTATGVNPLVAALLDNARIRLTSTNVVQLQAVAHSADRERTKAALMEIEPDKSKWIDQAFSIIRG